MKKVYIVELGQADIAAIQQLYGPKTSKTLTTRFSPNLINQYKILMKRNSWKNTSAAPPLHHHPLLPGSTSHWTQRYYLKGFEKFWLKINLYEIPLARSGRRSTCLYHVGSSKRDEFLVTSSSCLLPKIHLLTSISMLISPELDATLIQQSKNIYFNSEAISPRKSCPFSLLLHYL